VYAQYTVPQSTAQPRLLSVKALAAFLGCTVWAARTLLWEGEIPHIRIGKRHLVDPKDADAFIERQKEGAL
jgi:excisionase family DNA binding protein